MSFHQENITEQKALWAEFREACEAFGKTFVVLGDGSVVFRTDFEASPLA